MLEKPLIILSLIALSNCSGLDTYLGDEQSSRTAVGRGGASDGTTDLPQETSDTVPKQDDDPPVVTGNAAIVALRFPGEGWPAAAKHCARKDFGEELKADQSPATFGMQMQVFGVWDDCHEDDLTKEVSWKIADAEYGKFLTDLPGFLQFGRSGETEITAVYEKLEDKLKGFRTGDPRPGSFELNGTATVYGNISRIGFDFVETDDGGFKRVTFRWLASSGADVYEYKIFSGAVADCGTADPLDAGTTSDLQVTSKVVLRATALTLCVRARSNSTQGYRKPSAYPYVKQE